MRRAFFALLLLALCAVPSAHAVVGTIDTVPSASLLLPYFEVDVQNAGGVNTLMHLGNASSNQALAHVTVWSDLGIPVLNFEIRLDPHGAKTFDLRKALVDGNLPSSTAGGFASCANFLPYPSPAISNSFRGHLQAWLTGNSSPVTKNCAGSKTLDGIARGYVTVDAIKNCTLLFPSDLANYKSFLAGQNVLNGSFELVDPGHGTSHGFNLVSIEACTTGACNGGLKHTFYGSYSSTKQDNREALPTTFAVPVAPFETAELIVWRETNAPQPFACTADGPAWYPLPAKKILFANGAAQTVGTDPLPKATQRVDLVNDLGFPYPSGTAYLNLQHGHIAPRYHDQAAQAWVLLLRTSPGVSSASGATGTQLDNANAPCTLALPKCR
jgi:hypothetical protein